MGQQQVHETWWFIGVVIVGCTVMLTLFRVLERHERKEREEWARQSKENSDKTVAYMRDSSARLCAFIAENIDRSWKELREWCEKVNNRPCTCGSKHNLLRSLWYREQQAKW